MRHSVESAQTLVYDAFEANYGLWRAFEQSLRGRFEALKKL